MPEMGTTPIGMQREKGRISLVHTHLRMKEKSGYNDTPMSMQNASHKDKGEKTMESAERSIVFERYKADKTDPKISSASSS